MAGVAHRSLDFKILKVKHFSELGQRANNLIQFIGGQLLQSIYDALLDQLLEDVAPQLHAQIFRQIGELRILLQLVTVGLLELAEPDFRAVDLGRVVAANEGKIGSADEDEGHRDQAEDGERDPTREFFANLREHIWTLTGLNEAEDST